MKATVITSSDEKAVSELVGAFTAPLASAEIKVWNMSSALTEYCTGCEVCVREGETKCRASRSVMPVWKSMETSDVIVLAFDVYFAGVPASVQNLFDHLRWASMAHRPRPAMRGKRAVVLCSGDGAKGAAKYAADVLRMWGIGSVRVLVRSGTDAASLTGARLLGLEFAGIDYDVPARVTFAMRRRFAAGRRAHSRDSADTLDGAYWRDNDMLK